MLLLPLISCRPSYRKAAVRRRPKCSGDELEQLKASPPPTKHTLHTNSNALKVSPGPEFFLQRSRIGAYKCGGGRWREKDGGEEGTVTDGPRHRHFRHLSPLGDTGDVIIFSPRTITTGGMVRGAGVTGPQGHSRYGRVGEAPESRRVWEYIGEITRSKTHDGM
ncbi:hypothetical protein E2C01_055336 [Portunus trituberculatus]|uniref:Uncharacterized protein n=1 Tax=Portunus trituberculatus TaxID=210409 RepID=A0A5B7GVN2_PORTR|nr:hypothetical protein [Portunus trituberculatus]